MSQKKVFLIVLLLVFLVPFCISTDTISFNRSLTDGDLLISSEKSFALGFFSPGNSNKRYVGIWYNNVPEQTVVWVANRDNPITSKSGILTINPTGNLVILERKTKMSAWKTNISMTGNSYSAQLLDTGNFVLFQDSKRDAIVWQSLDYPTNTILADMKFGNDKKTGFNRSLTSWKSSDDPGSGEFVYKIEINGIIPQVFLYRNSSRIWRSGPWTGLGWSGVPEMRPGYIFSIDYIDNDSEVSVTFTMKDSSVISRLVLNESGTMNILNWQEDAQRWIKFWSAPKDPCDDYEHCGKFSNCNLYNLGEFECSCLTGYEPRENRSWHLRDGSNGCLRKKGEKVCNNGEGFVKLPNVRIPDTYTAKLNKSMGLEECEQLCLSNCSCTAYASANVSVGGTGCITWYGDLIDIREFTDGGQDFYIRVSASDLAQFLKNPNGIHRTRTIVIVTICITAIVIALLLACYLVIKRRRKVKEEDFTSLNTLKRNLTSFENSSRGNEIDASGHVDVLIFDLNTITSATDDFSNANKLGEGGFGSVYKGRLNNGQEIAVKRLSKNSGQGVDEFKNEVTLIARVQHRNLVRLLGCCIQRGEKMLVYEYLPNKGLDNFIFDKTKGSQLNWSKRFEIIVGIARGLSYLHHDSRVRIIHRDLKASNVLLDASMHPKISDFGTARIFGGDQIEANTNRVVGTYGYMSPEYAMEGHFSVKSDVFSFGVLLLEIITGRKNTIRYQDHTLNLVGYVWDLWNDEKAMDVVDPLLGDTFDAVDVLRCIQIGLLCVQSFANERPMMSEVVFMLCNETKLSNPGQPGFIFRSGSSVPNYSSSVSVGTSVNDSTITEHHAR